VSGVGAVTNVDNLCQELELYNPALLQKPAVIALNKIDLDPSGKITDEIVDRLKHLPGRYKHSVSFGFTL